MGTFISGFIINLVRRYPLILKYRLLNPLKHKSGQPSVHQSLATESFL